MVEGVLKDNASTGWLRSARSKEELRLDRGIMGGKAAIRDASVKGYHQGVEEEEWTESGDGIDTKNSILSVVESATDDRPGVCGGMELKEELA